MSACKFTVWCFGWQLEDPGVNPDHDHPYEYIVGQEPLDPTKWPDIIRCFKLCNINDAKWPDTGLWANGHEYHWSHFAEDDIEPTAYCPRGFDIWMKDDYFQKIPGWGQSHLPPPEVDRYVVDISHEDLNGEHLVACMADMLTKAIHAGLTIPSGLYMDDLASRCFGFPGTEGRWNPTLWKARANAMAQVLSGAGCMRNNDMYYYIGSTDLETPLIAVYDYVKIEGFHFGPLYAGRPGWASDYTWTDYFIGCDRKIGILPLMEAGKMPIFEAQPMPESGGTIGNWDAETRAAYAEIIVATACLAGCGVAMHEIFTHGASTLWFPAHDKALELGDAVGEGPTEPFGTGTRFWARQFEHGWAYVNDTANEVVHEGNIIGPYSGSIVIGEAPSPEPEPEVQKIVLSPIPGESGAIEFDGEVYTGHFPDENAQTGTDGETKYQGWLSFDATELPRGIEIVDAILSIPSVTATGDPGIWAFSFALADLNLDDLPGSYISDLGGLSIYSEEEPTAWETSLSGLLDVLVEEGSTRISFKISDTAPLGSGMVYPEVASATLTLYNANVQGLSPESGGGQGSSLIRRRRRGGVR